VLPALPGAPLVFLGLLLAAWIDGFEKVGWFPLVLLGLLMVVSFAVDLLATSLGAQRVGASRTALFGAVAGTVVGLFFGLPGLLLGPFLGAVAGEYAARRNWKQAQKVGLGTWIGLVLGSVAKIALAFTMLGLFVAAYLI
jgi:uncharacterized protein